MHLEKKKWWSLLGAIVTGLTAFWWFREPLARDFGPNGLVRFAPWETIAFGFIGFASILFAHRFLTEHLDHRLGRTTQPPLITIIAFGLILPLAVAHVVWVNMLWEFREGFPQYGLMFVALAAVTVYAFRVFLDDVVNYAQRDHSWFKAFSPTTGRP